MCETREKINPGRFKRNADSGCDHKLFVDVERDGDVYLRVFSTDPMTREPIETVIEFCNPWVGRGRSPNTLRALHQLAKAIKKDNEENPIK